MEPNAKQIHNVDKVLEADEHLTVTVTTTVTRTATATVTVAVTIT